MSQKHTETSLASVSLLEEAKLPSLSKSVSSCPGFVPTFDRGITQSYRNVKETH